ncbi:hypothetical protein BSKO_07972 [Bryopsis sp. KO-2023]|nr:hypothetical protein BSKO_07972 [Bryopsis sp. KO-2023]
MKTEKLRQSNSPSYSGQEPPFSNDSVPEIKFVRSRDPAYMKPTVSFLQKARRSSMKRWQDETLRSANPPASAARGRGSSSGFGPMSSLHLPIGHRRVQSSRFDRFNIPSTRSLDEKPRRRVRHASMGHQNPLLSEPESLFVQG